MPDKLHEKDMTFLLSRLKPIIASVMYAAEAETVGDTLERIADLARELIRARYAALGIPDGYGGLEFFMFSGIDPSMEQVIGHLPEGRGLLGTLMRDREPIRLLHIKDHPDSIGFPAHHPQMDSFLGVPIIAREHLFGILYLCDRLDGQPFSEEDQWLIETLAGYAALAIAGARLRETSQRLTQLEERERIGMELHDGIIQSLYAIGMQIELLRITVPTRESDLLSVMHNLNTVIEDIRAYILNLKSSQDTAKSIRSCIDSVLGRLYISPTLRVTIEAPDTPMPFSPTVSEAICQMVMEAISNVVRHAEATTLKIGVRQEHSAFVLTLTDDGRGFNLEQVGDTGLGLHNIQRRAQLNGGSLEIVTAPGQGTRLTLTLPIHI